MKKSILLLLSFLVIVSGCSSKDPNHPSFVVAKGKNFKITREELTKERNEQIQILNIPESEIPKEQLTLIDSQVLEQLITKKVLLNEAKRNGAIKGVDQEVEEAYEKMKERFPSEEALVEQLKKSGITPEKIKEELHSQVTVEKVIEARINPDDLVVSNEEVDAFYKENPDLWNRPEQILARHILVFVNPSASKEEITNKKKILEDARKRILNGEPFEKVAKEVSEDPGTKQYGGLLPPFSKDSRVAPEFTEMAFKQKKGKVSPIFKTNYGYHILEVLRKVPAKTFAFDEVKGSIEKQIVQRKKMRASQAVFQQIRNAAEVQVFLPKPQPISPSSPVEKQSQQKPRKQEST